MVIRKQQAIALFNVCKSLRENNGNCLPKEDKIAATRNFISLLPVHKEFQELKMSMAESFQRDFDNEIQQIQLETNQEKRNQLTHQLQLKENDWFMRDVGFIDFLETEIEAELIPFSQNEDSISDNNVYSADSLILILELSLFKQS